MTRTGLDRRPFLRAADLRILIAMIVGAAVFGIVDGSMWRGLLTPTIAYKPAILIALTLVFGWRGFVCSQIVFLTAFALFQGWHGALLLTPIFLVSYACALWTARTFRGKSSWLSGEKSTLAFLAAAAIAPLLPSLLGAPAVRMLGLTPHSEVPEFVDAWLRGFAAILVLTPAVLMCSRKLAEWGGVSAEGEPPHPVSGRNVLELVIETAVWAVALWMTVEFKARYTLNITYLTFLPPLAFTLLRGMRMATLAIAANGIVATTLWSQLHWAGTLPINDLRLLIAIYSTTILVMASVVDERKRASRQVEELRLQEAALRKSEEHFRTLTNSAPVMVWLSGTNKLCTFFNDPWLMFTGRTLTEELGDGWSAGVHPDDLDYRLTTYASSFDARRSFQLEYRLRRADGEYRWILDKGTPFYRDGEFAGYIGSGIDVTERKRADEALRESEERFRRVFEEGPIGLALVGRDYHFVKVNAALCEMVGYSEASLLQMSFADITHPDDLRADLVLAELLFKREIPFFTMQKRYVKKSGEIVWINLTASRVHDQAGDPVYGLAMIENITERKRAEEALRRSEARWNAAIENLGAAVAIATDAERVIYRNPAARAMHGFTSDQVGLGPLEDMARIFQLWTPDGRLVPLDEWPLRRIKRGETLNRLELRLRRLDQGWEKIISYSGAMVESAIGERLMFVSAQDLTDQRKAEHSLRESEERLRLLGDHLPDSAVYQYVDEPGVPVRCTYFSAGIERLTGVTAEDVVRDKSTLHRQILPEHMDRFVEARSRSKRDLSDFDIEVPMRQADGEIRWIHFHSRPRRLPDGKTIWDGVAADVTARKQAEDALHESQQRLVSIYNTVEDVIFHLAVEPAGQFRIVSVNAAFLRLTGLSQEKVVGKTVNEVIPEPSLKMVLGKYRQAIEEKTIVRWEEESDYPAGRLTGEVCVAPVFDNTGACTHLVGSIHDITEVKRAQEIESRLSSDLAASRDEIRALAASLMRAQEDERRRVSRELHDHICHQLGSLAVDIGKLIVDPPPPPKRVRAKLEAIRAGLVKTSQEAHDIAYQMRTAILDDLGLVASLKDLCSQFSEHYPDIAFDFEDSGPPAPIPSEVGSCLYRIAEESLQNIAKHSRAECVSVRLDLKTGAVLLTIQDDGAGFDPKAVMRHGGLGLISMRERAHSVNGKLTITAHPGHGTQVALEVPLPVEQPMKRPRVLLADDHPMILEEIRSVLALNCEIVETVADGRALVEAALRSEPDLIVVDITMPLMNGIEAAVQIKKSLPEMKLLFVTMHSSTAYLKAAFEAGGTGYVLKSRLQDELSHAVQSVLRGRTYVSHGLSTEYPELLQDPAR